MGRDSACPELVEREPADRALPLLSHALEVPCVLPLTPAILRLEHYAPLSGGKRHRATVRALDESGTVH